MVGFEVYRNGEKLFTAGVGDFGVLSAFVTWVSHRPEKLTRWEQEGTPVPEPTRLSLDVGGLHGEGHASEHLKWTESDLAVGDEIRVRIVDTLSADSPSRRYQSDRARDEERRREYVREAAKDLGWEIVEGPGSESAPGGA